MAVSEDQIRIAWAAIKREVQPVYDELPDSYRQFLRKRADNAVAFGPTGDAVFDAFERIILGEAPETPEVAPPPPPAPPTTEDVKFSSTPIEDVLLSPEPVAAPEPEAVPEEPPEPEKPAKKPVKRAPKKAAEKAPPVRKIVVVKKAAAKKAAKKAVKK